MQIFLYFLKAEEDNFNSMIASIQEQLRKANYENFSSIYDACRHQDIEQ